MAFLEAFLSDGLFMGTELPSSFLQDLAFDVIKKEALCKPGQVKNDLKCCEYQNERVTSYYHHHS